MDPTLDIKLHFEGDMAARIKTASEGIGATPTAIAKILMTRFGNEGAIPFKVEAPREALYDVSKVPVARVVDGVVMAPASWLDDDDE